MAPIYRSPNGETLDIPAKGIHAMETLGWVPANPTEAKAETATATKPPATPGTETPDTLPAGNASHDTWHTYALADGMAEDELDGLTRNQIRDLFIE